MIKLGELSGEISEGFGINTMIYEMIVADSVKNKHAKIILEEIKKYCGYSNSVYHFHDEATMHALDRLSKGIFYSKNLDDENEVKFLAKQYLGKVALIPKDTDGVYSLKRKD